VNKEKMRFGLWLSLFSTSNAQLVRTKLLFGVRWVAMGLSGHTDLRMLIDVRWLWTQSDTLNKWEENSSRHWGGSVEWTWILWFIRRMEQRRISPILHSNTATFTSLETGLSPLVGLPWPGHGNLRNASYMQMETEETPFTC